MTYRQHTDFAGRMRPKAAAEPATPRPEQAKGVFGLSRETKDVLCTVSDALRDFPEAHAAVSEALGRAREAREAAARDRQ